MSDLFICKRCSEKVPDFKFYPGLDLCATCAYREFIVKPCKFCEGTGYIKYEVYHDLETSSSKKYSSTCKKCYGLGKQL